MVVVALIGGMRWRLLVVAGLVDAVRWSLLVVRLVDAVCRSVLMIG